MSRAFPAAALLAAAACTPTFNWRETPIEPAGLQATFPCEPDRAERRMDLAPGRSIVLHAVGCEAGGAAFAVLYGDAGAGDVAATLAAWKMASLASLHGTASTEEAIALPGAAAAAMVRASGQRTDGRAVQSQAAYFARGTVVYQAVVYAGPLKPEMTQPFFAGLRVQ